MAVIEIPMPSNAVNPTYERVVYLNNSDMDQDDVTIQAFAQCAKLVDVPPENVEEKGCYFY